MGSGGKRQSHDPPLALPASLLLHSIIVIITLFINFFEIMNLLASEAAEDPRRSALLCLCRTTRRRRGYVHRLSPDWPAYHTKKKKKQSDESTNKGGSDARWPDVSAAVCGLITRKHLPHYQLVPSAPPAAAGRRLIGRRLRAARWDMDFPAPLLQPSQSSSSSSLMDWWSFSN